MSRFYGSLTGSAKTAATRRGGPRSGVESHVRGWDLGVKVEISDEDGTDVLRVYVTGGSNQPSPARLLAAVRRSCTTIYDPKSGALVAEV